MTFWVFVTGLSLGVVLGALMLIRFVQIGTIHVSPLAKTLPPMKADDEWGVLDPNDVYREFEQKQEAESASTKRLQEEYQEMVNRAIQTARTTREHGGVSRDPLADIMGMDQ